MRCPNCGGAIPSHVKFCAYCGAVVAAPRPAVVSQPRRGLPTWAKWFLGLALLGLTIGLITGLWPSGEPTTPSTPDSQPAIEKSTQSTTPAQPTVQKGHYYLDAPGIDNPRLEESLIEWIKKTYPGLAEDRDMFGDPTFTLEDCVTIVTHIWAIGSYNGNGYIFHSADGGNSWETQWWEDDAPWDRSYPFIVYFSSSKEGWVGSKDGLFYTQDGGKNWEFRSVSGDGSYVAEYWFYANGAIRARRAYGDAILSFDGGKTWETKSR